MRDHRVGATPWEGCTLASAPLAARTLGARDDSGSGGGGFETEAFAIADTMNYVGPDIETICVGTALGTAAMLLANGKKGKRTCLPNASIMLSQPRAQARGQASDIKIKATEILMARNAINTLLAEKTGQTLEKVQLHPRPQTLPDPACQTPARSSQPDPARSNRAGPDPTVPGQIHDWAWPGYSLARTAPAPHEELE